MGRKEYTEITNMCMLSDGKGRVLVQRRNDPNWGGITFPGGHVEQGESFVESTIREMQEETGLTVKNLHLCGLRQFYNREGIRYIVMLFRAEGYEGQLHSSREGEVFWVDESELDGLDWCNSIPETLAILRDENLNEICQQEDKSWRIY